MAIRLMVFPVTRSPRTPLTLIVTSVVTRAKQDVPVRETAWTSERSSLWKFLFATTISIRPSEF